MDWIRRRYWECGRWEGVPMDCTPRRQIEESNHPDYPTACVPPLGGYTMGGVPTDSIWECVRWAEYPVDCIRAPNGGYPLSGSPYELGGYPAGGCILQIEYPPLMGGGREPWFPAIGLVWGLSLVCAAVSRAYHTECAPLLGGTTWAGILRVRYGRVRFYSSQIGHMGVVGGSNTKRGPKLEYAKPPT